MKKIFLAFFLGFVPLALFSQVNPGKSYFPPATKWEKQNPVESGFDTVKLNLAIHFAIENESHNPRNMELSQKMSFGKEPFGDAIGPFADRGDPTGIIVHKGYIVAEWGEPSRVDMTHSVSKSFLSTVIGLAVEKGLIRDVNDTVIKYVRSVLLYDSIKTSGSQPRFIYPFASEHNKRLTWDVMLRQTSDWEGTLWGKPDWADRPDRDSAQWRTRKRNEPGTVWKYNDVRVNALALAATVVWKESLAEVLKKNIMDPIGASSSWHWYGYYNSYIDIAGRSVQAVSGGGHWGGGMFINAYDMARFGLLTLHRGNWNGRQLIPEKWIQRSLAPTPVHPVYGYMNFFLNTDKKYLPHAPLSAFIHVGNGANVIYVDPEHDLVVVIRWIESNAIDGVVKRVLEALN